MSILKTVSPEEATGRTQEIYSMFKAKMGFVPQALQHYSTSTSLMEQTVSGMMYFMSQQALSAGLLAFIRMLVSAQHNCQYCIDFNKGMLMQNGISAEALDASIKDPASAPLPEKEKALLLFVLKAVKNAHSVEVSDVDKLRNLGWSDQDIFEATGHGATMVTSDILLDAFKVTKD